MSVEATKSISLVPIVGGSDVGIIGDHKVILADLVWNLSDQGTMVALRYLGKTGLFQKSVVVLSLNH